MYSVNWDIEQQAAIEQCEAKAEQAERLELDRIENNGQDWWQRREEGETP